MRERIPEGKSKERKTASLRNGEVWSKRRSLIATDTAEMPSLRFEDSERLPYTDPQVHYHISNGTRHFLGLSRWLRKNEGDPAFTVSTSDFNFYSTMLSILNFLGISSPIERSYPRTTTRARL
jgi:hypothetical protein